MKHRFARIATVLVAAVLAGSALLPASASGSPLDDNRAEAARLQQRIDSNGDRIAALGEQYNGAMIAFEGATRGIADAQRRYDAAQLQVEARRELLHARAARLYTNAGSTNPLGAIDVGSVGALSRRTKYGSIASEVDSRAIDRLRQAQDDLARRRKVLEGQQAEARARKDAAAAARDSIQRANAAQRQLLGRVKGEIAQLLEQERQHRESEARSAALSRRLAAPRAPRAARGAVDARSVGGGNFPDVPTSGGVAAVIAYARAQLGKPYVFATAGPSTFDCSGLTMMAWRQAGVSMAHFSGAQYNAFPHVPVNALQPGDLVFKGPEGRDHVALYVGGGMQIAATHTGDFVRLQPLSSNLSGAVRPG